jgi:phospholipase B1
MLLSYFTVLLAYGIVSALPQWENTSAERMRILGPLAYANARVDFPCTALTPSPTVPTSVHALRPADIQHVAAIGDSLTAANGAKAITIIALLVEYRGVSWSIGGDESLRTVVTLPNIIRQFNSNLYGQSTGTGNRDKPNAVFNVAKAGAISVDMAEQADILVNRMTTALGASRFASEWKLVTFFIGGNDLCAFCKDTNVYSAKTYRDNVKRALDILHAKMPRTLVNFVTVLNVAELEDLHEGLVCQNMQLFLCDCAINKDTREQVRVANIQYQKETNALIDSGIYDTREDFTVVRQPFMEHMQVPTTSSGLPDFSYFAPDCFHFSKKGHEAAAVELWNNMMQKVGQKTTLWNLADTLTCPASGNGYIYTSKNSA